MPNKQQQEARFQLFAEAERFRQDLIAGGSIDKLLTDLETVPSRINGTRTTDVEPGSIVQVQRQERTSPTPVDDGDRRLRSDDSDARLGPKTTGLAVEARIHMTHIPVALIPTFEPEDRPLVSVRVARTDTQQPRRLGIRCEVVGYSAPFEQTVELVDDETDKTLRILPTFFVEQGRFGPVRATIQVEVTELDLQFVELRQAFRVWLLPRTTTVLSQKDPSTGVWTDLYEYLACWVTPDAPAVMRLLRVAADHAPDNKIVGYQVDAPGVQAQMKAIFDAAKAQGLVYVNSVVAAGANDAFVQRIRTPTESIENQAANCIDGTVLFASLLEAASLQPGIVLIPGHAFVAWRTSKDGAWSFLETTLTGYKTFEDAVEDARRTYAFFERAGDAHIFDVAQLRSRGILPLS